MSVHQRGSMAILKKLYCKSNICISHDTRATDWTCAETIPLLGAMQNLWVIRGQCKWGTGQGLFLHI